VPHRPPLTAGRLAQIWDEHPGPVVLELRWEIHRLRATVSCANQVRRMIGKSGEALVPGSIWACFEQELDAEPCLTDKPTTWQPAVVEKLIERLPHALDLYDGDEGAGQSPTQRPLRYFARVSQRSRENRAPVERLEKKRRAMLGAELPGERKVQGPEG
jgi:hypothetical protein